ncbi:phosphoenolpyruvate--protein phosphotransferase [Sphingomonas sp. 37zxx]|uniref:phosphoenolpyruvate--protein phosphotransferase n=1 Tax=Sphingomonas sp. 37zxx TaxID=1550073 RepID=UPI001E3A453A|nr:phosphoenolpyruvate--protein phosphotransferase [Sphingomonas sp. 37zxx]
MTLDLNAPMAGWCTPLDSVPDAVFAGRLMGDGVAIDPTGDTLHAPCDGVVVTIHDSRHAITLRADNGIELLMHIGIDTVALHGKGFTALVEIGAAVCAGDPLIRFDLDHLVQHASAVITPLIVTSEGLRVTPLAIGTMVAVGTPLARVTGESASAESAAPSLALQSRELVVQLAHGLHARPAATIAAALRELDADVTLSANGKQASARSVVGLLGLSLGFGDHVVATTSSGDAPMLFDRLAILLSAEAEVDAEPAQTAAAPRAASSLPENALQGVGAAPGLAIGPAFRLTRQALSLPSQGEGVAAEHARLNDALAKVQQTLRDEAGGTVSKGIATAHLALLDDPALRDAAKLRIEAGAHAGTAFHEAALAEAAQLRSSSNHRLAERADDLEDIGRRIAFAALGKEDAPANYVNGGILIAAELLPSHLLASDAQRIGGIALEGGGATSHVAILAASLGIPMVVALGKSLEQAREGMLMVVDGDGGAVLTQPDDSLIVDVAARINRRREAEDAARAAGDRPTRTADDVAIAVYANLGSVTDAEAAIREGAEGSGLLRTEFLFLERPEAPGIEEQARCYREIAETLDGRPLTIRLLDIGGDKPASYLAIPAEENPALGERGVRVLLTRPALLETQLRAILRAQQYGPIRVMVPMIVGMGELAAIRETLHRLAAEENVAPPPLGVMVETPAAALLSERLAETADFLSIGSNDLTQYTLAMDRGNPAVAATADALHPAVLRLIEATCKGAAQHDRPVGLCGGLAADPLAVPILIGLGVRSLSVPPQQVPRIKAVVSQLRLDETQALAGVALGCGTAAQVRAFARDFSEKAA